MSTRPVEAIGSGNENSRSTTSVGMNNGSESKPVKIKRGADFDDEMRKALGLGIKVAVLPDLSRIDIGNLLNKGSAQASTQV